MNTLLIIDDDMELFTLLDKFLKDEGFACSHAIDGAAGFNMMLQTSYDLVILDFMLPGENGFQILERVRAEPATRDMPVLMLTARGEESDLIAGLEHGADDYLAKPFSVTELLARLKALLRRAARPATGVHGTNQRLPLDDLALDKASMSVVSGENKVQLTVQEMRLLELFANSSGEILGRNSLCQAIFGHPSTPDDRSLDMLVSRVRKKIGKRSDGGERIRAARGEGYVFLTAGAGSEV